MRVFKKILLGLGVSAALLGLATASFAAQLSPVGYWQQISDKTGKLHSIVKIWQAKDQLKGKVMRGFSMDGKPPAVYCTECSGARKNKKIVGMTIIWGMKYNPSSGRWEGGRILDPKSGSIYKANMTLMDGGKQLKVRGYIGISLFGRSQVWYRIPANKVKQELSSKWQPKS